MLNLFFYLIFIIITAPLFADTIEIYQVDSKKKEVDFSFHLPTALIDSQYIEKTIELLERYLHQEGEFHFQNTKNTKRETYTFGYSFFRMVEGDKTFVDIPPYLKNLCQKAIDALGESYHLGLVSDYQNVIISIYQQGYFLEPHVDVDFSYQVAEGSPTDFYFGENVIGIVLEADAEGHFYLVKVDSSEDRLSPTLLKPVELKEQSGLAYLLTGEQRREPFFHGVTQVQKRRISVTFRTVHFLGKSNKE